MKQYDKTKIEALKKRAEYANTGEELDVIMKEFLSELEESPASFLLPTLRNVWEATKTVSDGMAELSVIQQICEQATSTNQTCGDETQGVVIGKLNSGKMSFEEARAGKGSVG